jgi:hypothetical protein
MDSARRKPKSGAPVYSNFLLSKAGTRTMEPSSFIDISHRLGVQNTPELAKIANLK